MIEKWRSKGLFATSIGIRQTGGVTTNPNITGFINQAGTLMLTQSPGTVQAGSAALLDLSYHRFRVPVQGTTLGTASTGLGSLVGGSAGGVKVGYSASQGMLGIHINGTVFQLAWATGGGSVHVTANPAGA